MNRAINPMVIGIGGGGCRLADALARDGYNAVAFNTAVVDLAGLKHIPREFRIRIGETEGAGKMPELGKRAFLYSRDEVARAVEGDRRLYIVTVTLGGGTGTGAVAPLVDLLLDAGKQILVIAAIPESWRGIATMRNASRALRELHARSDSCAVMLLDNVRICELFGNANVANYYREANGAIARSFDRVNRMAGASNSFFDGIDRVDLLRLLTAPGYAVMGSVPFSTPGRIVQSLTGRSSLFCDVDLATARGGVALAISGSAASLRRVNMEELTRGFNELGDVVSAPMFFGAYIQAYKTIDAFLLATGLQFPARLRELAQAVKTAGEVPAAHEVDPFAAFTDDVESASIDYSVFL